MPSRYMYDIGWAICCPDGEVRLEALFDIKQTAEDLSEEITKCETETLDGTIDCSCPGGSHTVEPIVLKIPTLSDLKIYRFN